jgi:DNA-binding NarL/FixJ family response regulator
MQQPQKELTVFIVDDDRVFAEALKHYISDIENLIMDIQIFHTGEECLEHMTSKPDVIILDYYLNSSFPNASNGIDVLKKIKGEYPRTKVLMLSAQDNIEVAMNAMKYGAFDYISKSESAMVKIRNTVSNVSSETKQTKNLNNKVTTYRKLNIAIIVVIVILFIISRIFTK